MDKDKLINRILNEWSDDIVTGVGFSGIASWLKYVFQHFIDVGWTVLAALVVMLSTHYGRKYLIPWIDRTFKL